MAASNSRRAFTSFVCQSCRQRLLPNVRRSFATSTPRRAEERSSSTNDSALKDLGKLAQSLGQNPNRQHQRFTEAARREMNPPQANSKPGSYVKEMEKDIQQLWSEQAAQNLDLSKQAQPHRLHVYAHKHNTHITFVQPPRTLAETARGMAGSKTTAAEQKKMVDVLLSLSAGNIGFRKAGRGSYDAAFQLAAFALKQIQEKGMMRDARGLEVVLKGFGAGREAVTKALLGSEGRNIRTRITSVKDATRLKQGGPRSRKPRRLG